MFDIISPEALAGAGIAVAFVVALLEMIKRTMAMTADAADRFGPLMSVILGVVLTLIGLLVGAEGEVLPRDLYAAILQGIAVGLAAVGLYKIGGQAVIESVAGKAH